MDRYGFVCSCCGAAIAPDSPVYMSEDRSYCSAECREQDDCETDGEWLQETLSQRTADGALPTASETPTSPVSTLGWVLGKMFFLTQSDLPDAPVEAFSSKVPSDLAAAAPDFSGPATPRHSLKLAGNFGDITERGSAATVAALCCLSVL
mmetsp:Transcript_22363/g.64259  ORF Transcript_22363/g.64259 Transcript_22363/m.64259 type:complete len:150 (+) Transcript_22363:65-514(+)